MNLWRWLQMRCRDEVQDLRADVHRLEGENAKLTQQYLTTVQCNHEQAESITALRTQLEKRTIELGDMRRERADATAEIERLMEDLDTAQYMRGKTREAWMMAESKATSYVPGGV